MFRLSKKVEYAIIALQYMASKENELVSAKEMSENLNISFEFLSKTLQSLMKHDLVQSHQGIKGGYSLARKSDEITLSEVINCLDEKSGIVECLNSDKAGDCGRTTDCTIRDPMHHIQNKINNIFSNTTISELGRINNMPVVVHNLEMR